MNYLNDRQRVEIAVPARLVFGLAVCKCFSDPDHDDVKRLQDLLLRACIEPLDGLQEREGKKIARRVERVVDEAAKDFDQQPAVKIAMSLFYFLEHLLATGYLELWEGSPMGEAMSLLMPMFDHGFEKHRQDRSAQKQARRLLQHLQRQGYYAQAQGMKEAA